MKKIITVAAVAAATLFAAPAFAQAKSFEGFSVGLNADWINANFGSGATDSTESSVNASIQGQYNFALGSQYVLGLGATYELTKPKLGTIGTSALTGKNLYTVYVAPGYVVNNTTVVYGKLSSISNTTECTGCTDLTMSGYGFGAGFQMMMEKNWYIQGEAQSYKMDDKTVATVVNTGKGTIVSFGVGYKF